MSKVNERATECLNRLMNTLLVPHDFEFKEQEKMKRYEINLEEAVKDLKDYLNDDVYTEVSKNDNEIYLRAKGNGTYIAILTWRVDEDLKWERRWEVETVNARYYYSSHYRNDGMISVAGLFNILDEIDDFLGDWYDENPEPKSDNEVSLPEFVKNKLLDMYNSFYTDIHTSMSKNSIGDEFLNLEIINRHPDRDGIRAKYLIIRNSAFVVDFRAFNEFITSGEEFNALVRKCVKEWDQ